MFSQYPIEGLDVRKKIPIHDRRMCIVCGDLVHEQSKVYGMFRRSKTYLLLFFSNRARNADSTSFETSIGRNIRKKCNPLIRSVFDVQEWTRAMMDIDRIIDVIIITVFRTRKFTKGSLE